MTGIFGIVLVAVGAWFVFAHHHLTNDARYISVGAMILGGILIASFLGGLAR